MSDLTKEEKDELLLGLSCHSSHEVESTFITMAQMIKNLERQLAEAREALLDFEKHVIKHNYHVSNPILNKHETLLKQLKEKGE
jgi:hypothetical protein